MVNHEVDDAFEWLVLMLGVVTAILTQYPQFFYTTGYSDATATSLRAAIAVIPPMFITVVLWLVGKLSRRDPVKALSKIAAWMLILSTTWLSLYRYCLGVAWATWGIQPGTLPVVVGLLAFLLLSPAITLTAVLPRYREMFPGLRVLRSKAWLLAVYAATQILVILCTAAYVRPD